MYIRPGIFLFASEQFFFQVSWQEKMLNNAWRMTFKE